MTVTYEWSPDSRHFLTAILFPRHALPWLHSPWLHSPWLHLPWLHSPWLHLPWPPPSPLPRLRVDNGYRVWSCNGALEQEEKLDELSLAAWRPAPSALYPAPDENAFVKPKGGGNAAANKTTATAAKYVPRHMRESSGAAASAGGTRGSSLADLAKAQESGGTAAAFRPGQAPLGAETEATSASSAKNKAKREAKKAGAARALEAAGAGVAALAVGGGAAAGGGGGEGEETADKIEKKIRNVEKKLRQIVELKELVAGGKTLEANQLGKIKAEDAVREELAGLQAALQGATPAAGAGLAKNSQDEGKWR